MNISSPLLSRALVNGAGEVGGAAVAFGIDGAVVINDKVGGGQSVTVSEVESTVGGGRDAEVESALGGTGGGPAPGRVLGAGALGDGGQAVRAGEEGAALSGGQAGIVDNVKVVRAHDGVRDTRGSKVADVVDLGLPRLEGAGRSGSGKGDGGEELHDG